nr:MAG TPA: hypothetical protein [Caudoviricetes sp.]
MLYSSSANSRNSRRANTCFFRKFLLRHFVDSKKNLCFEFYHFHHLFLLMIVSRKTECFNTKI